MTHAFIYPYIIFVIWQETFTCSTMLSYSVVRKHYYIQPNISGQLALCFATPQGMCHT